MQQTTNYNLNLPEGTDIVNPLVDYNPNFSTIDSAMKANSDRTVGHATCIKSGTTHVVTRSNTGSNIINFTATGDWNEGDTMTIDSTVVSVFLPDGNAALDGAFIINSEVFGILNGTRFTLYSNISDLTAANVSYSNTSSGLQADNAQTAIDELASTKMNKNDILLSGPITVSKAVTAGAPATYTNASVARPGYKAIGAHLVQKNSDYDVVTILLDTQTEMITITGYAFATFTSVVKYEVVYVKE